MNERDLTAILTEMLLELRAAGRGAAQSVLGDIFDRSSPGLAGALDGGGAIFMSPEGRAAGEAAIRQKALVLQGQVQSGEYRAGRNGQAVGGVWPFRDRLSHRIPRWTWGIAFAGAVALLVLGYLAIQRLTVPEGNFAQPKGGPTRSGPEKVVPKGPGARPEGSIAEKSPKTNVRVEPMPRQPRRKDVVASKPERAGNFGSVIGEPMVFAPNSKKGTPATPGMTVVYGSRIETGDFGKAWVQFADGTELHLDYNTTILIPASDAAKRQSQTAAARPRAISLEEGRLYAQVQHLAAGDHFRVQTPVATAEVVGTEFGLELVQPKQATERLKAVLQVKEGRVAFYNDFGREVAGAMMESTAVDGSKPTEPKRIQQLALFDKTHLNERGNIRASTHIVTTADALNWLDAALRLAYPLGWVGIRTIEPVEFEPKICEVRAGSPAQAAGLEVGDIVVSINGKPADDFFLVMAAALERPGRLLRFELLRNGQRVEKTVVPVPFYDSPSRGLSSNYAEGNAATWKALTSTGQGRLELWKDKYAASTAAAAHLKRLAVKTGDPALLNNAGVIFELRDELGEALRMYQAAVRSAPTVWLYRYNYAKGLRQIGNFARSNEELRIAFRLNSADPRIWADLSLAASMDERYDDSVRICEDALKRFPNDVDLWMRRADGLLRLGRAEDAVVSLETALKLEPRHYDVLLKLGMAYFDLNRLEDAEEALRKSIEVWPGASSYGALGVILYFERRYPEAEEAQRKALGLDPDDFVAMNNLGNALRRQGKLEEAEDEYERSLRTNPGYVPPYANLARLYEGRGRIDEAITMYRKCIALEPRAETNYLNLALLFENLGNLTDGEQVLRDRLILGGASPLLLNNLAYNLAVQGVKLDEALALSLAAVKARPDAGGWVDTLGYVYMKRKEWDQAIRQLRRSTELYGDIAIAAEIWVHLGQALEGASDTVGAKEAYRKALALDPKYQPAKAALDRLGG